MGRQKETPTMTELLIFIAFLLLIFWLGIRPPR